MSEQLYALCQHCSSPREQMAVPMSESHSCSICPFQCPLPNCTGFPLHPRDPGQATDRASSRVGLSCRFCQLAQGAAAAGLKLASGSASSFVNLVACCVVHSQRPKRLTAYQSCFVYARDSTGALANIVSSTLCTRMRTAALLMGLG